MKKRPKFGTLLWCAEGGDVKQVEVTIFQRDDLTATRVKYPNDDVTRPWRCLNVYLFKTKKAAQRMACKQIREQIEANKRQIESLHKENYELKKQLDQYDVDHLWYWIADLSIEDCILAPKRIPPVLKKGHIADTEDDGTYRLVNKEGLSSFVPGNKLFATAKAAWADYNRTHKEKADG